MQLMARLIRHMVVTAFFISLCVCTSPAQAQTFNTIINVPPDTPISHLVSHTQLNVFDGGLVSTLINAGASNTTSTDIEVNIEGGRMSLGPRAFPGSTININGGTVGDGLEAFWASTVNINGGVVGDDFVAHPDSTISMTGGTVGDRFDLNTTVPMTVSGGTIGNSFDVFPDSRIEVTGGILGDLFRVRGDGLALISGGIVGDSFTVRSGGTAAITGGSFGERFGTAPGSRARFIGGEFLLDGQAIAGLGSGNPVMGVNLPPASILTGRLADGSVVVLSSSDGDVIADGTLQLAPVALPPQPSVINAPNDPAPKGLTSGQTLNLADGAVLGRNFAAVGATINIAGGEIGSNFEVVDSLVSITGGSVGEGMDVFSGSTVNISGGLVGDGLSALHGSTVNIGDTAEVGSTFAYAGGTVNLTGGSIGLASTAKDGGTFNISGGALGLLFTAEPGSVVNIDGGTMGLIFLAKADSEVNLVGTSFILGGVDLTPSLTPGVPFTITDRNTLLQGELSDGTPIFLDLDTVKLPVELFSASATLTVTLIPEPAILLIFGATGLALLRQRPKSYR